MMEDDKLLLKKAHRRAGFRVHIAIFILANLLLWIFWYFVLRGRPDETAQTLSQGLLFILLAWFVIIMAHYLFAYKWNKTLVEKELRKLEKERKKQEEKLESMKEEMKNSIENNEEIK